MYRLLTLRRKEIERKMKKRFLTLFTTVAVIAATTVSIFAAAPQEDVVAKKLKPLDLVEISDSEEEVSSF